MASVRHVVPNFYRDSVFLMQISEKVMRLPGIQQAAAVMATESNIDLLRESGILDAAVSAGPNDLLIVIQGDGKESIDTALAEAETLLAQKPSDNGSSGDRIVPPHSIEMALAKMPEANLALISTPGEYAAAEALKALRLGLNVMLFSDNVSLDDEVMLKQVAHDRSLLVMGPDCGTAIINGVPLGFANVVRRGTIGIVAASGTGLQQVSSLIHQRGGGISQAIGIGSHDLHERVGGSSMLAGIAALSADPETQVIVLISKPPSPNVAENVLDEASRSGKPVVVDFLGADPSSIDMPRMCGVATLEDAALAALAFADGKSPGSPGTLTPDQQTLVGTLARDLTPDQKYVRGLFSGGTFCFETVLLLGGALGDVYSNTPLKPELTLPDVWKSQGHTLLDLGDDHFTQGRPHPMIDPRLRNERIIKEAADPQVGVILLDVVLGYGSHMDPASELVAAIQQARSAAGSRKLVFIAFVCGTDADPQGLTRQEQMLRDAGVTLTASNAQAARLAAAVVQANSAG
jgi:succinyl-CoA synthetase alpha subunit